MKFEKLPALVGMFVVLVCGVAAGECRTVTRKYTLVKQPAVCAAPQVVVSPPIAAPSVQEMKRRPLYCLCCPGPQGGMQIYSLTEDEKKVRRAAELLQKQGIKTWAMKMAPAAETQPTPITLSDGSVAVAIAVNIGAGQTRAAAVSEQGRAEALAVGTNGQLQPEPAQSQPQPNPADKGAVQAENQKTQISSNLIGVKTGNGWRALGSTDDLAKAQRAVREVRALEIVAQVLQFLPPPKAKQPAADAPAPELLGLAVSLDADVFGVLPNGDLQPL